MNHSSVMHPVILAVDDNEDNLLLLEYQLREVVDCQLITATNGNTALALAHSQQPRLILMDILLPEMDGVDVIRLLKQSPATAEIPVIAVTALARKEDRDRILATGCSAYLSKPYDLDEFAALVQTYLQICQLA